MDRERFFAGVIGTLRCWSIARPLRRLRRVRLGRRSSSVSSCVGATSGEEGVGAVLAVLAALPGVPSVRARCAWQRGPSSYLARRLFDSLTAPDGHAACEQATDVTVDNRTRIFSKGTIPPLRDAGICRVGAFFSLRRFLPRVRMTKWDNSTLRYMTRNPLRSPRPLWKLSPLSSPSRAERAVRDRGRGHRLRRFGRRDDTSKWRLGTQRGRRVGRLGESHRRLGAGGWWVELERRKRRCCGQCADRGFGTGCGEWWDGERNCWRWAGHWWHWASRRAQAVAELARLAPAPVVAERRTGSVRGPRHRMRLRRTACLPGVTLANGVTRQITCFAWAVNRSGCSTRTRKAPQHSPLRRLTSRCARRRLWSTAPSIPPRTQR